MTGDAPRWSAPEPAPPPGWAAPIPSWTGPALPVTQPDVRPGVVPLRPLGVGEIIDGAISTMRRHWRLQLGLSAAVVTVTSVLQAGALYLLYRNTSSTGGGDLTGPEAEANVAANLASVVTTVVGQLAQMVLIGVLAFIVSRAVLGQDVTPGQAWAAARPHLWRLVLLSVLLLGLVVVLLGIPILAAALVAAAGDSTGAAITVAVVGELVALPLAVWLWVRLGVAAPALVLERAGVRSAMRRSARLVRTNWWRAFGILLLGLVISFLLGGIIQTPFGFGAILIGFDTDGSAPGVWFYVLSTVGAAIAGTITYPFTAGVAALLYIDLRMRREALDLTLVRAARGAGTP